MDQPNGSGMMDQTQHLRDMIEAMRGQVMSLSNAHAETQAANMALQRKLAALTQEIAKLKAPNGAGEP